MSTKISIYLRVKFRAWLFTFGTIERNWIINLPVPIPTAPREVLREDKQGVFIAVALA